MSVTADLLAILDNMTHETSVMLQALDRAGNGVASADAREVRRRILDIRGKTQECFDWLSETRLDQAPN